MNQCDFRFYLLFISTSSFAKYFQFSSFFVSVFVVINEFVIFHYWQFSFSFVSTNSTDVNGNSNSS